MGEKKRGKGGEERLGEGGEEEEEKRGGREEKGEGKRGGEKGDGEEGRKERRRKRRGEEEEGSGGEKSGGEERTEGGRGEEGSGREAPLPGSWLGPEALNCQGRAPPQSLSRSSVPAPSLGAGGESIAPAPPSLAQSGLAQVSQRQPREEKVEEKLQ